MEAVDALIVDGANVVGSRPDGWWRDRAGAAARLQDQLRAATFEQADVWLVLEGQARSGVPEGRVGSVTTLHAPHDGDAAIADLAEQLCLAGPSVRVVTADRALANRVMAVGASVAKPGWLLAQLDSSHT